MGEKSAELEREIADLRVETGEIFEELEHRLRHATDVRAQVTAHPAIAAAILSAIVASIAAIFYTVIRGRMQETPAQRMGGKLRRWRGSLTAFAPVARAQQRLTRDRERTGDLFGKSTADLAYSTLEKRQPSMLKRVLWSMLTAGTIALVSILARRLLATVWMTTFKEPPPRKASE